MQAGCRLDAQDAGGLPEDSGVGLGCTKGRRTDAGMEVAPQRGAVDIGVAVGDGGNAVAAGPLRQYRFDIRPGRDLLACVEKDGKRGLGKGGIFVLRKFFGVILLAVSIKFFIDNLMKVIDMLHTAQP